MTMRLLFVLLIVVSGFSQQPVQIQNPCLNNQCFHSSTSLTLSSSASTVFTIQNPATGFKYVQFNAAVVQCTGQTFTVSQAQNGTAATTTAGTVTALLPTTATATAKAFTASNVGAGTAMAATLSYGVGDARVIDLSQRVMNTAGANYSITLTNTGGSSCTATVDVFWYERQ